MVAQSQGRPAGGQEPGGEAEAGAAKAGRSSDLGGGQRQGTHEILRGEARGLIRSWGEARGVDSSDPGGRPWAGDSSDPGGSPWAGDS